MADTYNTTLHSQRVRTMYFPRQLSPPYITMAETANLRPMFFYFSVKNPLMNLVFLSSRTDFAIKSELTEIYAHHFEIYSTGTFYKLL